MSTRHQTSSLNWPDFDGHESRVASPLVPLRIFLLHQVRGANIAMVLMAGAMVGVFFILTLYQQQLEGYSA
jgi:hypothetical protein